MWDVTPTGAYTADCETGEAFGIEFLKTCDGTCTDGRDRNFAFRLL
jgi:hypothetical protein